MLLRHACFPPVPLKPPYILAPYPATDKRTFPGPRAVRPPGVRAGPGPAALPPEGAKPPSFYPGRKPRALRASPTV